MEAVAVPFEPRNCIVCGSPFYGGLVCPNCYDGDQSTKNEYEIGD